MRILLIALLFSGVASRAELIPADKLPPSRTRVVNGVEGLGVVGGIPARTSNLIDVSQAPYNLAPGGDIVGPVSAAIANVTSGGAITIPSGNYTQSAAIGTVITGGLYPKGGFTIRGAGSGLTNIRVSGTGSDSDHAIIMGLEPQFGADSFNVAISSIITNGLDKDSTSLTLVDATDVQVGKMCQILYPNDPAVPVFKNNSLSNFILTTTHLVTNKVGNVLTITPPVLSDYTAMEGTAVLMPNYNEAPIVGVGIEGITFDLTDGAGGTGDTEYAIKFSGAYNCWIKDVKYVGFNIKGCLIFSSINFEYRKGWQGPTPAVGSNGSGLIIQTSTNCLFEDSIFEGRAAVRGGEFRVREHRFRL